MMKIRSMLLVALLLTPAKTTFAAEQLLLWEAMERAVVSNPAIKSQQVEIASQALEQAIARGQRLPKLDLSAAYTHHAYPTLVTPIREAGVFPPLDRDVANIGVALNWPLYAGGKLVAGEAMAAHNRDATVQALRSSEQDLLFNVVATYTKALHFRQLGKALDVRIKALQQEERDLELRLQQGSAARLELIRVQTQVSQARYDKVAVTQAEQDAVSLLVALLGESGPDPVLSESSVAAPPLPVSAPAALDRALQKRPDLLRLDAMGRAAQQKTAIARGERLPQVNLVARAQESAGSDWEGYDDWQMGVQLSLPLFDGHIRQRRVDQAGLAQRQNALQQDDTRNRIASEVRQAFGALSESRARLEVATRGEREASEALRIETLRYRHGENTITDLLGAESALWAATASRLQAEYDITVSQARLLRATGELAPGSFKPPAARNTPAAAAASGPATGAVAQYLAWHRCGGPCDADLGAAGASAARGHAVAPARQDVGAAGQARRSIQQGAKL